MPKPDEGNVILVVEYTEVIVSRTCVPVVREHVIVGDDLQERPWCGMSR